MVNIIINNHKSRVECDAKLLDKLRNRMKIKAKGYFFSPAWRRREWDGYVNYITEKRGEFDTGLLGVVCDWLRKLKKKFEIEDQREGFKDLHIVSELGDLTFREDQKESLYALLNHKLEGIKFIRGIMAEATNYGKSLIIAGTFASFSQKRRGLVLVNQKVLFDQVLSDLQKLLGKEEVGWVKSGSVKWSRVNVCMVQTLGNQIKKNPQIRNSLVKMDIVLIDEYDLLIGRKDCKFVLQNCYNASVRVGFTGTELMSKDKNRNMDQIKFCGPVIHKTTNKDLVDRGVSSKPNIAFYLGNKKPFTKGDGYEEAYQRGIVKNKARNKKIWKITAKKLDKGPVLILFKLHSHGHRLMASCNRGLSEYYNVKMIHHKTPNREATIEAYNEGKIDVLIASMIIRRGINLPYIRTLINAAGGDSEANILQIFGRGLRKSIEAGKKKDKIDIVEFYDKGEYLQRHSKHRIRYYKQQKFPVKELYKKKLKGTI